MLIQIINKCEAGKENTQEKETKRLLIFRIQYLIMEEEVGKITHYYDKIGVAIVEMTGQLKQGDRIAIRGATTNFEQKVESMQIEHVNVELASKGDVIGLKTNQVVREGDKVYKLV